MLGIGPYSSSFFLSPVSAIDNLGNYQHDANLTPVGNTLWWFVEVTTKLNERKPPISPVLHVTKSPAHYASLRSAARLLLLCY